MLPFLENVSLNNAKNRHLRSFGAQISIHLLNIDSLWKIAELVRSVGIMLEKKIALKNEEKNTRDWKFEDIFIYHNTLHVKFIGWNLLILCFGAKKVVTFMDSSSTRKLSILDTMISQSNVNATTCSQNEMWKLMTTASWAQIDWFDFGFFRLLIADFEISHFYDLQNWSGYRLYQYFW